MRERTQNLFVCVAGESQEENWGISNLKSRYPLIIMPRLMSVNANATCMRIIYRGDILNDISHHRPINIWATY